MTIATRTGETITPILQFGTSRFLQAHADLFIGEALERGEAIGPITTVQTSGDAGRRRRLQALAAPEGFPVRIQGLENGQPVSYEVRVRSVRRALEIGTDFAEVCRIAAHDARILLSNTGDAGWNPSPADAGAAFDAAMSYPAKLTHLLRHRYRETGMPVQVMPTELIAANGARLRERVLALAAPLDPAFAGWVESHVRFVNSLVDRIVSEPLEPAGAIAEPYALWAIEDCPGLELPCRHPAVRVVAALAPVERLKLHILNLGHTVLADGWQRAGRPVPFVRQYLADPAVRAGLEALYRDEVMPVFAAGGMGAEAQAYALAALDRFANPTLDHRLADIAGNHAEKAERRIAAFIAWGDSLGLSLPQPGLRRVLADAPQRMA